MLGYYAMPHRFRNVYALAGSILFYSWGAPKFVFVLLAAVVVDFYLAQKMATAPTSNKKALLSTGIVINLTILIAFKYLHFFANGVSTITRVSFDLPQLLLPIGISFFTFHEISYLVDVYRAKRQPFYSFINYALYIFFFPQLIAGPIIRFNEIAAQIEDRTKNYSTTNVVNGFFRFMLGLFKKVLVADVMGETVDAIFSSDPTVLSTQSAWFGAVFNIIRIGVDFSAYSDMAIGLALMLGFVFPENFNSPFIAKSMGEYWERWHMSLGRWIRDYLYLPLGGSKGTLVRTCFNLMLVFVISGLWHGADLKYIIWGALFGLAMVGERILRDKFNFQFKGYAGIFVTFFTCIHILLFFSTNHFSHAAGFINAMYTFSDVASTVHLNGLSNMAFVFSLIYAFGNVVPRLDSLSSRLYSSERTDTEWVIVGVVSVVLLLVNSAMLFVSGYHPFLYFKF